MIERVAKAIMVTNEQTSGLSYSELVHEMARAAIKAMRELPGEPGPRYTAGEYSRRTQAAMVDDALGVVE